MKDIIESALENSNADYLEIRLEDRQNFTITYRGEELDEYSNSRSTGGFIRAITKGGWGYASFTDLKQIPELCRKAERASRTVENGDVKLAPVEIVRDNSMLEMKTDPADIHSEDKEALVRRYNEIVMGGERIQSSVLSYGESVIKKSIFTSEGSAIEQESVNMLLSATAIAREGERIQTASEMEASTLDYDKLTDLDERIERIVEKSQALLDAKPAKPGKFDIVIDPRLTGVFAHEAFGHLSEADFVSQNENLTEIMKLKRQFGNENLNIIDDGTLIGLPGCFKYDDEGVKSQKTYLIKKGKLTGRLHSRETAARMNEPVTGNARAVNFFLEPVVRMTCTYVEGGEWKKDEMISDVKDGYYVQSSKGGQTNLEMFTFSGEDAYRIEDGEITEHIRDLNLSGNLFETLKNIDAVGDDVEYMAGGYCGKGEHYPLPVSYGGPHIRIRDVVIGGG